MMKIILITLSVLTVALPVAFGAEKPNAQLGLSFHDPRQTKLLYEWMEDGREIDKVRSINRSILIICWQPDPLGNFDTYQISGIDGYFPKERIEAFLNSFYARQQLKEAGDHAVNVIVAGNNWGAGHGIREKLQKLSKEHRFSVFYSGGWAFHEAVLIKEPEPRLEMIRAAFEQTTNSEQTGADQPATAPQAKAEGKEKRNLQSERRSE